MTGRSDDTIFAVATGAGRAAVAIVRLSGPRAQAVAEAFAGALPPPRHARLVGLYDPRDGALIDRGIVLSFPGSASFSGEDSVEFQLHGSRAVLARLGEALSAMPGCRLAEPGEFTRRAFLNGKMDLAEVEGLADLVDAETEVQRQQAIAQLSGILTEQAEAWRAGLLSASALIEAEVDFSDEGDTPREVAGAVAGILAPLKVEIDLVLADKRGELFRDGLSVVIAGPPNAGKSSLLNALARRDVAIVSATAGTTRDLIEVHLDLDGVPVVVVDTAGIREARDAIESEGVRRALRRAENAALVLWLSRVDAEPCDPPEVLKRDRIISVTTQIDRLPRGPRGDRLAISVETGEGLDSLIAEVRGRAKKVLRPGEPAVIGTLRQRKLLAAASAALGRALALAGDVAGLELIAEELRLAARRLSAVSGRIEVEDVLGEIFSRFCIGK